jgi:Lar family restriction alleviation protein
MTIPAALSCPFCGSANVYTQEGSTFRWMLAECQNCGARGPEVRVQTLGEGTREEWLARGSAAAIAEWNSRAETPQDIPTPRSKPGPTRDRPTEPREPKPKI